MVDITFIVPAYNEAHNIQNLYRVIPRWFCKMHTTRLVLADDGSTDGTPDLAGYHGFEVLRLPHGGKAAALVHATRALAEGTTWLAWLDIDLATDPAALGTLWSHRNWAQVILADRGERREGMPWLRRFISRGLIELRAAALGIRFDTQCGYKLIRADAAINILDNMIRYKNPQPRTGFSVGAGFDLEFVFVARELGYQISAVPVAWHNPPGAGRRVYAVREVWRGLSDLFAIYTNHHMGLYRLEVE
jgi:glycosyltransferase involved in cell wall biosynthesis